jgi:hypothetical protein
MQFIEAKVAGDAIVSQIRSTVKGDGGIMDRMVDAGDAAVDHIVEFMSKPRKNLLLPLSVIAKTCHIIGIDGIEIEKEKEKQRPRG